MSTPVTEIEIIGDSEQYDVKDAAAHALIAALTGRVGDLESALSPMQTKLATIQSYAEVNQNAFSKVKVGSSTAEADSKTDTLTLVAGTNIQLVVDQTNDKITINNTMPSPASPGAYVTEQSESGSWRWRKWSDGTIEAWAALENQAGSYAFTTAGSGGNYYTNSSWVNKKVDFPAYQFFQFHSAPTVFVNVQSNGYLCANVSVVDSGGDHFFIRAWAPYSSTQTIGTVFVYAVGK